MPLRAPALPIVAAAHEAVKRALYHGRLFKQPCERCGTKMKINAHHEDYTKPLEVMWLCAKHHKLRHKELAALALIEDAA